MGEKEGEEGRKRGGKGRKTNGHRQTGRDRETESETDRNK